MFIKSQLSVHSIVFYQTASDKSSILIVCAGIVRFHEVAVSETDREGEESRGGEEMLTTTGSLLEQYVQSVRDSLGVHSQ